MNLIRRFRRQPATPDPAVMARIAVWAAENNPQLTLEPDCTDCQWATSSDGYSVRMFACPDHEEDR